MKAITYTEYGPPDVLRFTDVAKPAPRDDEVLIRVRAASANPLDWHCMRGTPYVMRMQAGLRKPKFPRLGVDVAGQVEAVGSAVTQFRPGDEVFGVCKGAFSEYACAPEGTLLLKPANVTFEQAAAAPVAAFTALQGLRDKGRIRAGQTVLINGAAGGVGTFAVQIANRARRRTGHGALAGTSDPNAQSGRGVTAGPPEPAPISGAFLQTRTDRHARVA